MSGQFEILWFPPLPFFFFILFDNTTKTALVFGKRCFPTLNQGLFVQKNCLEMYSDGAVVSCHPEKAQTGDAKTCRPPQALAARAMVHRTPH